MLLLIDAGNTKVKWALVPAAVHDLATLGQWSASGAVEHARIGELVELWRSYPIGRVLLANVAGGAVREALEQALAATLGLQPVPVDWFASVAELAGVRNGYRNPAQLGCDRFAALIGARALYPEQALVVASCGTATTVDALDADGVFAGGMILPGLGLMATALATNTAQLPAVTDCLDSLGDLDSLGAAGPFADHTEAAIAGGCLAAQVGAIERALAAQRRRQGDAVRCVLAGGAAGMIARHLSSPPQLVDNLVLIGLHTVVLTSC